MKIGHLFWTIMALLGLVVMILFIYHKAVLKQ